MEYCDTLAALKLVTKSQLSSPRMDSEVGCNPVATVAGLAAIRLPDTGLIFNCETVLESVPST